MKHQTYCEDCGETRPEKLPDSEGVLNIYCPKHLKEHTPHHKEQDWEKEFDENFDFTFFNSPKLLKSFIERQLTSRDTYWKERVRKEVERIENELDKHIAPHPLSLEDSVWLKRLLNKVFQHEQRTN